MESGSFFLSMYFLAGCPLLCDIVCLGREGEVDVSELNDSVSEHEKLFSLSTIE